MTIGRRPATAEEQPDITDNAVLDEFRIPFGDWIEQSVNWIDNNLQWALSIIEWPFEFLLRNLVDNFLEDRSWLLIVGIMFLVSWLFRSFRVAVGVSLALTVCGLLGQAYWLETARTLGLIGVSVVLCVLIGIPVGVLCGRFDGVWTVVRPVLDAMQVIHSFVYMLPFVFFWGIGEVSATMAMMVFALPPLIRLTNLGIRQVPEDVVEASRAYGATELRVLSDVQLPLARPAIMTGINQTLLLAISMLGVAAIIGAGGLGSLLFRAIGQLDVALAAAAGLAFYLVAIALDRLSQPDEGTSSSLLSRIHRAWAARRTPEVLLDDSDFNPDAAAPEPLHVDPPLFPLQPAEVRSMVIVGVGAVLSGVSLFLPWGNDAGKITGYSRRTDEDLAGESFNGLAAEGGSWYGFVVAGAVIAMLIGLVIQFRRPGTGPRWYHADGVTLAAFASLAAAFSWFILNPSDAVVSYSDGIGTYLALAGGVVSLAGALMWMRSAPHGPRRPLRPPPSIGRFVAAGVALLIAIGSMFSAWTWDERQDAVLSPEIQAQIDEINAGVEAGEIDQNVGATQILSLQAQASDVEKIIIDGKSSRGSGLGIWVVVFMVLGALAIIPGDGLLRRDDRTQWIWSTVSVGFGLSVVVIATGWVGSLVRATDPNFVSGVGLLLAGIAGVNLMAASVGLVKGFERNKVYADIEEVVADVPAPRREPADAAV